jgi:competence/damage-inducible protein CinA-like protein
MAVEIITIGTELLLGDIVDSNSQYIARALREAGIDVHWITTVGDNPERITRAVRLALSRAEGVITTGGLGPTVDDPTREAVARAADRPLEFRPELWQEIQDRMARWARATPETNRRQAYMPQGAAPIANPVGTAPGFILEHGQSCVLTLPGVPREMQHMLGETVIPYLSRRLGVRAMFRSRVLHVAGIGEAAIDEKIGDFEALSNPTVGLAAHNGIIDVRITAKGEDESQMRADIERLEAEIRQRLPEAVFGADEQTLEGVALAMAGEAGLCSASVEWGAGGKLAGRLAAAGRPEVYAGGLMLPGLAESLEKVEFETRRWMEARGATIGLGLSVRAASPVSEILIVRLAPQVREAKSRTFGGPQPSADRWGVNVALYFLWRSLREVKGRAA